MRAEFYCKYGDDKRKEIGFYIIPESKTEANLLELTRKSSDREIFEYHIEFKPGDYIALPTYEDVSKIGEV
jgi:hypothetical protein